MPLGKAHAIPRRRNLIPMVCARTSLNSLCIFLSVNMEKENSLHRRMGTVFLFDRINPMAGYSLVHSGVGGVWNGSIAHHRNQVPYAGSREFYQEALLPF